MATIKSRKSIRHIEAPQETLPTLEQDVAGWAQLDQCKGHDKKSTTWARRMDSPKISGSAKFPFPQWATTSSSWEDYACAASVAGREN